MKTRLVDYYYVMIPNRPGEGGKLLAVFRKARVNLRAVHAFPVGRQTQVDLVPKDNRAFLSAARKAGVKLSRKKQALLVEGKDRVGGMAGILERTGATGVNVTAVTGVGAGSGRFGVIFWVKPRELRRVAKALDAK